MPSPALPRALVTGASGGIGGAIVRALARRGHTVVLSGRRTDVLEALAAEVGATAAAADLSNPDDAERLVRTAAPVDVLVANAALPASGDVTDYTEEQIIRAVAVNLTAPILLARAVLPGMIERRRGHIVFISSLAGKVAPAGGALYAATKFGIRGFALGLREDVRVHGVGVSVVSPGFIRDAGMFADSGATLPPGVGTRSPADVARAVVRAIERNRAETDVAPLSLRLGTLAGVVAPQLAAAATRRLGGDGVAAQLTEGQRAKR